MPTIDRQAFLRLIRGETRGPLATAARAGLSLGSAGYGLAVAARNLAFSRGLKAVRRADVSVVSVGNLTLGGTGKTPTVEWIARWYRARGLRVAILSRGYGEAGGLNDEGRVLEENLPDVPHLQHPDRADLARIAVEELESQVLVLDDGFQHRRLARDLDVVLLDALDPFGGGRLFPRGLLREPIRSLGRAGIVALSRADLVDEARRRQIRREAERLAGPLRWAEVRHVPRDLADTSGNVRNLSAAAGLRVAAFCGIGNPEGFRRTLLGLGLEPVAFLEFDDHHRYGVKDLAALADLVATSGADLALTTQKDLVKLRTDRLGPAPLLALRIGLEVLSGLPALEEALGSSIVPEEAAIGREGTPE